MTNIVIDLADMDTDSAAAGNDHKHWYKMMPPALLHFFVSRFKKKKENKETEVSKAFIPPLGCCFFNKRPHALRVRT